MNFRDVEFLSAYLDGQLSPSETARIESRLSSDPNLRAVMDDLRKARGLLRQLPARKAPRNFTLTRKMVGLKPPLPRAYPIFRFATAIATVLLVLTFAVNSVGSRVTFGVAAPQYGLGGGGGGSPESSEAPAPEEAMATEAPATEAPAAEPFLAMVPTETLAAADSARQAETPIPQAAATEPSVQKQADIPSATMVPVNWQIGLVVVALVSALTAFLMRRYALQKWK